MKRLIVLALLWPMAAWAQAEPQAPAAALLSQDIVPPKIAPDIKPCALRRWNPPLAVPRNLGATALNFDIAVDGSVQNVVVATSSGSTALDESAVECARQWKYIPATKSGQPISVQWKTNIQWGHR